MVTPSWTVPVTTLPFLVLGVMAEVLGTCEYPKGIAVEGTVLAAEVIAAEVTAVVEVVAAAVLEPIYHTRDD